MRKDTKSVIIHSSCQYLFYTTFGIFARKMLMKLIPGVNFTNVLQAAFTQTDPKSAKKYSQATSLFCALGICGRKSCT